MNRHLRNPRGGFAVTAAGFGVAALLALAGCGEGVAGGTGGGGGISTAPVPSAPPSGSMPTTGAPPPVGATHGTPLAAKQVSGGSGPADSARVFTRDGGRTLGVVVEQKGCEKVGAHLAEQSAERVVMVVTTENTAKPGAACPMHVVNKPVTVHLTAPLGDRTVVLRTS